VSEGPPEAKTVLRAAEGAGRKKGSFLERNQAVHTEKGRASGARFVFVFALEREGGREGRSRRDEAR